MVGGVGQSFSRDLVRSGSMTFCDRDEKMMVENARAVRWSVAAQEDAQERAETTPLWNEAQLNCVSLRSELDCEVAYGAVKGQDERPLRGALDSPISHHWTSAANVGKQIKEGRHVGLDFYDLLIEAIEAAAEATKLSELSMERVAWRLGERAGHNMSKR